MEQVTKSVFIPRSYDASRVREDLLSNGLQFKLIDMSDARIVCENSWPHILRIKRNKAIHILLEEDTGPQWPSLLSEQSTRSISEEGNAIEDRQDELDITIAADPPTTAGPSGEDRTQIVFRARELSRSRFESPPPRSFALSGRRSFSFGQETRLSGPLGEIDNAITRPRKQSEPGRKIKRRQVRSPELLAPRVHIVDKKSNRAKNRQLLIPYLKADTVDSRHRSPVLRKQKDGHNSRKHCYGQRSPPPAGQDSESPLQYKVPPYAGAGWYGYIPSGPMACSVHQRIPYSGCDRYASERGARLQSLASTALNPTDLFYTPLNPGVKNCDLIVSRKESKLERHNSSENTLNQSKSRMITGHSSDLIHDDQYRSDKARGEAWIKSCNEVLSNRHVMTYVPEPPDWPCQTHDRDRATRSLKACGCNLRRLYSLLGYQARALRRERMRWHPDRFSICSVSCRKEIQTKAEEIYKELVTGKSFFQCLPNS